MKRWLSLSLCVVALAGCKETKAPAGSPPTPAAPGAKAAVPVAPAKAADAGTTAKADALDPDHFVGFSGDEAEFAWSSYSDGAGFYILTIVASTTGARVTDVPLDSPAAKAKARSLLEAQRFTATPEPASAALPAGTTLKVTVPDGIVTIALVGGERTVALRPGKDFLETSKHFGAPKASLWGFSPKGTYAAVKLTQGAGAELGTAVAYHVVDVKAGLESLGEAGNKK